MSRASSRPLPLAARSPPRWRAWRAVVVLTLGSALVSCRHAVRQPPCYNSDVRSGIAWGLGERVLQGRVIDFATGAPLADASVRLEPGSRYAITDSAGIFRMTRVAQGSYLVRVRRIGFEEARASVTYGEEGLTMLAVLTRPPVGLRGCSPVPRE